MIAIRGQGIGRDERGSVLVGGLMLVLVMTLIGSAIFQVAVIDNRMALGDAKQAQAFYVAEAGMNVALRKLMDGTFKTLNGSDSSFIPNTAFGAGSFSVTAAVTSPDPNKIITVTSTGCVPGVSGGNPCTTLQGAVVYHEHGLVGPFFALGTFTINGLVDSFDSSQGTYCDTKCPGPQGISLCQQMTPQMGCGADIYANGAGAQPQDKTVTLNTGAKVFGNVFDSRGQVNIGATSETVYGDVTYDPTLGSCVNCTSPQVQGQVKQATIPPVVPPAVGDCRPYSSTAYVNSKITPINGYNYTDTGSKAGEFSLKSNNVVTITPGEFCFKSFKATSNNVGVTIPSDQTGRVVISVLEDVDTSSGEVTNNTGKADRFQILSGSTTPNKNVTITGGNNAYIYVYAPKTQIKVAGSGNLYGALLGNDLTATGGAQLHFDKALGDSGILVGGVPQYTWVSGSWKACKNPSCT